MSEKVLQCPDNKAVPSPPTAAPDYPVPGPARKSSRFVLNAYERNTLVRQLEYFGDLMLRLLDERKERGWTGDEREQWMGDEAARWYDIANAVRSKSGLK